MTSRKEDTIAENFWSNVAVGEKNECWEWQRYRLKSGYGRLNINYSGEKDSAHRVAWEKTYGPIPEGLCVLHHCDNPPCVNPSHLFLGTYKDNSRDRDNKGRNRGAKLGAAAAGAKQRAKTHCLKGHPFDEKNTHIRKDGKRVCRTCSRRRDKERYWRINGRTKVSM